MATTTEPRKIDNQNRVALPKEVLEALGRKSGDYLAFEIDSGQVVVKAVRWST